MLLKTVLLKQKKKKKNKKNTLGSQFFLLFIKTQKILKSKEQKQFSANDVLYIFKNYSQKQF